MVSLINDQTDFLMSRVFFGISLFGPSTRVFCSIMQTLIFSTNSTWTSSTTHLNFQVFNIVASLCLCLSSLNFFLNQFWTNIYMYVFCMFLMHYKLHIPNKPWLPSIMVSSSLSANVCSLKISLPLFFFKIHLIPLDKLIWYNKFKALTKSQY